jgi:hypothetical protein
MVITLTPGVKGSGLEARSWRFGGDTLRTTKNGMPLARHPVRAFRQAKPGYWSGTAAVNAVVNVVPARFAKIVPR